MSKVNFKHNQYSNEEIVEFYHNNSDELFELRSTVTSKYRLGALYCDLTNGIWDEDKLGEFKGELFACIFSKYLLFTTSPYALLKYNAIHSPHLEKNLTEEEFDTLALEEIYNDFYMSCHQEEMKLFFGEALMNIKANQSPIRILGIVDNE